MLDVLRVLRRAIAQNQVLETLDAEGQPASIENAVNLRIPPLSEGSAAETLALDSPTEFESQLPEPAFVDLRTVLNSWLTRELSITEYIAISDERGIKNLKFLERTDLIAWLDGSSDSSENIKAAEGALEGEDLADAAAEAVNYPERTLQDHRTVLHGSKLIDFSQIGKQANREIIQAFRQNGQSNAASSSSGSRPRPSGHHGSSTSNNGSGSGGALLRPGKNRDPIILLSPSPSSLINMSNVKDFLERGQFEPVLRSSSSPNLHRIIRQFKHLGNVKFVVVDSVAQFKPEYWDRVVALFVTGQTWQLKQYKWSDPHQLFAHVLGFAIVYKNDVPPETLKHWNVKIEQLERNQRFRDREVVERIWDQIEQTMIARGWPVKH